MLKVIILWLGFTLPLLALEHYEVSVASYQKEGNFFITLRKFKDHEKTYYLTLNPYTLETAIQELNHVALQPLDERFKTTPFASLLKQATSFDAKGGAPKAFTSLSHAIYLTMDLCPSSKKGYENTFLENLTAQNGTTPIAIAVSSAWITHHESAFKELVNNPRLDITWVNHTFSHFYDPHLPNHTNFMLHKNTNVKQEILGLEQTLIEHGVTPSVFFRFPGLIADKALMKELKETYFLIPLSANAWIAKNQPVKEGSFILVHGNKNEPQGIKLLEAKLPKILKTYQFHAIKEAFVP